MPGGWKYAALLSYAGTGSCGWQRQKGSAAEGGPSIQAAIEQALARITGEEPSVVGSGRTDSGVHSVGQTAHFTLERREWNPELLRRGLNSQLPPAIRAARVVGVPADFHAQRSAERKQYSYYFQQGPCALPHLEPYSWWIQKRLDLAAIGEALGHLRGQHDFKPFQAAGSKPGPTVREILQAEVTEEAVPFPGGRAQDPELRFTLVRVRLVGTGFLKQMVRGIAGTLLQVGERRRAPECIREILASRDRSARARPRALAGARVVPGAVRAGLSRGGLRTGGSARLRPARAAGSACRASARTSGPPRGSRRFPRSRAWRASGGTPSPRP
jgi:tRNA pseudouridine38-40 synthase